MGVAAIAVSTIHKDVSAKFHCHSVELPQVIEPIFVEYGVRVAEGAAGELGKGDLKMANITAAGYDQNQSFLLVEISGVETLNRLAG